MSLTQRQKIMCGVVLAAAVFAVGSVVRSCGGKPGEGTVKVSPGLMDRIRKRPIAPPTQGKKTRAKPPNIKDRLRGDNRAKDGREPSPITGSFLSAG
jgi:hypothetical protein